MIKILFVCHGNICRSTMAEYVMKDMLEKKGLTALFEIDSAATSREEIGNPIYPPARKKLMEEGVTIGTHRARQVTKADYKYFDKIYIMASDALSRQTIQRRGRVLRTCTETGKRIAYIYDFVALPPIGSAEGIGVSNLVINEMRRAKEYARLADNKTDIMDELRSIMGMYGVNEEDLDNEFDTESE